MDTPRPTRTSAAGVDFSDVDATDVEMDVAEVGAAGVESSDVDATDVESLVLLGSIANASSHTFLLAWVSVRWRFA
jgi:hypothetical protein